MNSQETTTISYRQFNGEDLLLMRVAETIPLFYDPGTKNFVDEDGFIVWAIFELISPNDLFLFRRFKDYMVVQHRSLPGVFCELYYPEEDDTYDYEPGT